MDFPIHTMQMIVLPPPYYCSLMCYIAATVMQSTFPSSLPCHLPVDSKTNPSEVYNPPSSPPNLLPPDFVILLVFTVGLYVQLQIIRHAVNAKSRLNSTSTAGASPGNGASGATLIAREDNGARTPETFCARQN